MRREIFLCLHNCLSDISMTITVKMNMTNDGIKNNNVTYSASLVQQCSVMISSFCLGDFQQTVRSYVHN